jgi:hypothetical protein
MMSKRKCYNCGNPLPPESKHYILNDEAYCTDCVDAQPYTAHVFYVGGEYMGNSEDAESKIIEDYEDEYEEEETPES